MTSACTVTLRRGSLCFTRSDHQRFLAGVDAVVLLREGTALLILPVLQAAGGYLLKQRNLAGDRVAHAAGFFRENGGVDEESEVEILAEWAPERAGLVVAGFFAAQT